MTCFLDPIATPTPRSDAFSRSDCDPDPSKGRVFSVRLRSGHLEVSHFLGPIAPQAPLGDPEAHPGGTWSWTGWISYRKRAILQYDFRPFGRILWSPLWSPQGPPRSDVSRPGRDPGPSRCRVFSGRWQPGPLEVTCFLGPIATRSPRSDVFSRSEYDPDPQSDVFPRSDCDPDPSK